MCSNRLTTYRYITVSISFNLSRTSFTTLQLHLPPPQHQVIVPRISLQQLGDDIRSRRNRQTGCWRCRYHTGSFLDLGLGRHLALPRYTTYFFFLLLYHYGPSAKYYRSGLRRDDCPDVTICLAGVSRLEVQERGFLDRDALRKIVVLYRGIGG